MIVACAAAVGLAALAGLGSSTGGGGTPGYVRVSGHVVDAFGQPVAGAVVRDSGVERRARSSRTGAFSIVVPTGDRKLVAARPGFVSDTQELTLRRPTGATFDLWKPGAPAPRLDNSANRIIWWLNCRNVATASDAQLERWKKLGVSGIVCSVGHLQGLGGDFDFRKELTDSGVIERLHKLGMDAYLGFYASNPKNEATPFAPWFDDHGWSSTVLPAVHDAAAAARKLGFKGVALDQELYDHPKTASWDWRYPGDKHSEKDVRAEARKRGQQLMQAILSGFPGAGVVAYYTRLPGSWEAHSRMVATSSSQDPFADSVQIDMWDGMSSVRGYSAIRWLDSWFYKQIGLAGATWDQALQYNARAVYSLLSRRFSAWDYASSRIHVTPFAWIDADTRTAFTSARPPSFVAEQLAAFRRWGTGGSFGNYAFSSLTPRFDYAPYAPALRDATKPGTVDSETPQIAVTSTTREKGGKADLAGTAGDNFALRVIRWRDDQGHSGTAQLTPDDTTGNGGAVTWKVSGVPAAQSTRVWLLAEDIKGLATVTSTTAGR